MSLLLSRRTVIAAAGPLLAVRGDAAQPTAADDWPTWAERPDALYRRLDAARATGRDLRAFGAACDGRSDDTAAFERALASDTAVLVIPRLPDPARPIRLTRQIRIARPILICGFGAASAIRWEGMEEDAFLALGEESDPSRFLKDVRIDSLHIERGIRSPRGHLLQGVNVRGVSLTRCSTRWMGGLLVNALRSRLGLYKSGNGSWAQDPAVLAGFSPQDADDLNEDIAVHGNSVDGGAYMVHLLRANFARRVAAADNVGRFSNISWWGGGAKRARGGNPAFLRRVRDLHIVGNSLSGCNGGIYGNNGDGIRVARNRVAWTSDVGIDFEGCFNAVAHDNVVRNAGNFCLCTFYAARNIVFRDNDVVQDGSAAAIYRTLGTNSRIGNQLGRTLFALRSSGFGAVEGAIDVTLLRNRLAWKGSSGTGTITPSYFGRLRIAENQLSEVLCDLRYGQTGEVIIEDNRLRFERQVSGVQALIAASAKTIRIRRNHIFVTPRQIEPLVAIRAATGKVRDQHVEVQGNDAGGAAQALVIEGSGRGPGDVLVEQNRIDAIYMDEQEPTVRANRTAQNKPIVARPIPEALRSGKTTRE